VPQAISVDAEYLPSPADPLPIQQRCMSHALVFVLAPEALLPADGAATRDLVEAQRFGLRSGVSLRLYRTPADWEGQLEDLVEAHTADAAGSDPFGPGAASSDAAAPGSVAGPRRRLICDALVPHLEPRSHWLGVYLLEGDPSETADHPFTTVPESTVRCLDRFPLRTAENETCWFYPTEDGRYLGWENQRRIETWPGFLPERPFQEGSIDYERSAVHVLWSLMADDLALTCVGLTYRGRRIEWPVINAQPEPFATWSDFQVDSSAESTYQENTSITVFAA
jgi:hypothetical protein